MPIEMFDLIILGFGFAIAAAIFVGFSGEAKKVHRNRDEYDTEYDAGHDRHYGRKRSRQNYNLKKTTH